MVGSTLQHINSSLSSPTPDRSHEQQLVRRVISGDPMAEREFYNAHVDAVYRLAYRVAGDPELAKDFTQEAFVRAFDRLSQFRGEASVSTWMRRVAMSVVLNGLERVNTRKTRETPLEDTEIESPPAATDNIDLKDRLTAAIGELPSAQRGVIMMHDVEGFTHQEIADALGITVSSSKVRLFRARARLRIALADLAEEWI